MPRSGWSGAWQGAVNAMLLDDSYTLDEVAAVLLAISPGTVAAILLATRPLRYTKVYKKFDEETTNPPKWYRGD